MLITVRLHVDEGQEAPFCCAFILVGKQTVFMFHHAMMAGNFTFFGGGEGEMGLPGMIVDCISFSLLCKRNGCISLAPAYIFKKTTSLHS